MKFEIGKCSKCHKNAELMYSNNPLAVGSICFDCINEQLDYNNLNHADFFCRTFNLPFDPELWINLVSTYEEQTFKEYTTLMLEDSINQPNLYYSSTTHDLWSRTNKEWEKNRVFTDILAQLEPIKESYVTRGRLKWGTQYNFEELIRLDSIYTRTLKANNVTNPLQKEAIKMLCKMQIELDDAIRAKDAKAIKDFSSAYASFAKQADLETMINESRTDDITTVAELYDYMEKEGFQFTYYSGADKDEVDRTIKDINAANSRLILESTGLQTLLEDMIKKRQTAEEEQYAQQVTQDRSLEDLLNFSPDDTEVDTESDEDILNTNFEDDKTEQPLILRKDTITEE